MSEDRIDLPSGAGRRYGDLANALIPRLIPSQLDADDPEHAALMGPFLERYRFAAIHCRDCTVLDIACGCGYGAAILRAGGAATVTGVDFDDSMIDIARREYAAPGIEFHAADLMNWAGPGRFARIVCHDTLKYLPDPAGFLRRLRRMIADDGILVLSAYITPTTDINPYHRRDFTRGSLSRLLRRCGFAVNTEYLQIKRFGAGRALSLTREKRPLDPERMRPQSLPRYYLTHPRAAGARLLSLLRDGLTVRNLTVRAHPIPGVRG